MALVELTLAFESIMVLVILVLSMQQPLVVLVLFKQQPLAILVAFSLTLKPKSISLMQPLA